MPPFLRKHSQLSGHLPKKQTVKAGSVIRAAARVAGNVNQAVSPLFNNMSAIDGDESY